MSHNRWENFMTNSLGLGGLGSFLSVCGFRRHPSNSTHQCLPDQIWYCGYKLKCRCEIPLWEVVPFCSEDATPLF